MSATPKVYTESNTSIVLPTSDQYDLVTGHDDTISGGISSSQPQASTSVVTLTGHDDTLNYASPNGQTFIATGTGDVINDISYTAFTDTSNVILAGTQESFNSGSGDTGAKVSIYGTRDFVTTGAGSTVDLYGKNATVMLLPDARADSLVPIAGNTVTAHGTGQADVTGAGGLFTFKGDAGSYRIDGGSSSRSMINGGSGGGTFLGGEFLITKEAGEAYFVANNTIVAGLQKSTLVASDYGTSLLEARGHAGDILTAGQHGTDTLTAAGSTGNNLLQAYQGTYAPSTEMPNDGVDPTPVPSAVLTAGCGNDTLVAGSGQNILNAGSGHDIFRFVNDIANQVAGGNSATVNGFVHGTDKVDLQGFSASTAAILKAATYSCGGTTLHLSDGASATFAGVTLVASDITRHS